MGHWKMIEKTARFFEQLFFSPNTAIRRRCVRRFFSSADLVDRGWALGVLTGEFDHLRISRKRMKQALLERVDLREFEACNRFIGEVSETIARLWPVTEETASERLPALGDMIR